MFGEHRRFRPLIDATFEGYFDGYGNSVELSVDAIAEPEIAQLRVGTDILLGGNSSSSHISEICSRIPTTNTVPQWSADFLGALVTPETEEWEAAVVGSTERRSVRQRKRVYSSRYLDQNHLAEWD